MRTFKHCLLALCFIFLLGTSGLSAAQLGSQSTEIAGRGGGGGHGGGGHGGGWGSGGHGGGWGGGGGHHGNWGGGDYGHRGGWDNNWGGSAFYWGPSVGLYNYTTPSYYYDQYPYDNYYPYYNYYYNQ